MPWGKSSSKDSKKPPKNGKTQLQFINGRWAQVRRHTPADKAKIAAKEAEDAAAKQKIKEDLYAAARARAAAADAAKSTSSKTAAASSASSTTAADSTTGLLLRGNGLQTVRD
ncbi:hypothetical protein SLS54_007552 [Diplodia seriata]